MIRVRDIMTREVVSLSAEVSVDHAIWSLSANCISAAPVRDDAGRVIGVLSKSDLVDPVHHGSVRGTTLVGEAMTPAVWAVHPDAPASDALEMMVSKGIHRVLVMERQDRVDGIVTSMDVVKAVARGMDLRPYPREARREPRPEDRMAGSILGS